MRSRRIARSLLAVAVCTASPFAQELDLELRLYRAATAAAEAALRLHETDRAQAWLAEAPAAHRGFEWRVLAARADASARGVRLNGGTITDVAVGPDGALVATASGDGVVRLLDAESLGTLHELEGHAGAAWSPEFSHDGSRLATAGSDGTLRLWDVASGAQLASMEGNGKGVAGVAWSPDDARIVVCSWDLREGGPGPGVYGTVRVWNTATLELERDLEHGIKPLGSAAWSADGALVAVGSWDSQVAVFDTATWGEPRLLFPEANEHYQATRDMDFAPTGHALAVSYADGRVRLWDADAGAVLHVLDTSERGHVQEVNDVCFASDAVLASVGGDLTLRVWDVASGRELALHLGHERAPTTVAAAPDGRTLYTAGEDRTVRAWDLGALAPARATWRLGSSAYSFALDPTATRSVSAAYEGWVRVHDVATGTELFAWEGHASSGVGADWSPDGRRVATTGNDGRVALWDAESGALLLELCDASGQIETVAFQPDGSVVAAPVPGAKPDAAGGERREQTDAIRLWTVETGAVAAELAIDGERARHPVWSPGGDVLAVAYVDGRVRLWDTDARRVLRELDGGSGGARPPAFTADGRTVATIAGTTVRLWDVASGALLRELPPRAGAVQSLAFSPDGTRLAGGMANHALELWDPRDGAVLLRETYASSVWAVCWHPTGDALYAAVLDGTIRVLQAR